jgi:hypothetical protein
MNCLSSFGGLNTLQSFSFADLYPVEHPTTKHFTISPHDVSKTHHHNLKNEIIKRNNEMESKNLLSTMADASRQRIRAKFQGH